MGISNLQRLSLTETQQCVRFCERRMSPGDRRNEPIDLAALKQVVSHGIQPIHLRQSKCFVDLFGAESYTRA